MAASPHGPPAPHSDSFAAELRGFGPLGMAAILLVALSGTVFRGGFAIPAGALIVLLWRHLSDTQWRAIGYVRPKNWALAIGGGAVLGIALKVAMKALVMPLFGADPINRSFHYLAGNQGALPGAIWMMFVAGFGEETVFRGFAFDRLAKLLGRGVAAKVFTVILTSALFALAHYSGQGRPGVEQATVVGVAFGTIFARTGSLPMLMIAHTAFDLTALAIIYWNLEWRFAHLIFK